MRDAHRAPARLRRRVGIAGLVAAGIVTALALAGCSAVSSTTATTPLPSASAGTGRQGFGAGRGGGTGRGGIFGLIAAETADVLQVQGDGMQTAVSYTAKTTIRRTEKVAASTIAVGDCVVAVTPQKAAAATSITVTAASSAGTCTLGFGAGPGGRQGAFPRPSAPPQAPSGGAPQPRASRSPGVFGRIAIGKVTAASATALTVQTTTPSQTTTTTRVTLGASTVITATVDATAAAIKVGMCVRATGKADDKGGFAATALTLSDAAADGTCTQGFGGRGFGGFGGGNGGSGSHSGWDGGSGSSGTGAVSAPRQSTGSTTNG